eukprot:scaffold13999_cov118-Isochrysis_galbana.AAC.1
MGSIPHPKEVCEHPNSHAERKLRDRWDAALRLFSTGGVGDILCEIAATEFHLPPSRAAMQFLSRLKDVLWWWRVEPALLCWMCPGRGFCVEVSSAESCSGRQLPVWRCL